MRQSGVSHPLISPGVLSILACATLGALIASSVAGTLGAAAFAMLTGMLFAASPLTSARDLLRYWPLLLLPVLAIASTIWSDSPERSMRAGLQLMLTFIAAILISRRISASSMILTLLAGFTIICLLIVPDIPRALLSRLPLYSALLGSKNQVAFASHILVALSLAVAADSQQRLLVRLLTPLPFALGLVILLLAQSAGALTSLALTLLTFPAFLIIARVNITVRLAIVVLVLFCAGVAVAFLPDLIAAWNDFQVNVLKKDLTLTGRTYLWDFAARLSAERPWLGRGYYAFWRHGNIDAEGLWRWGGIASRSGFNFHNAYIEMQVDLGRIGLVLLLATMGAITVLTAVRQIMKPSTTGAFFLSYLMIILIRGFSESVLISPFSLMSLILIGSAIYALNYLPSAPAGSPGPLLSARSRVYSGRSSFWSVGGSTRNL